MTRVLALEALFAGRRDPEPEGYVDNRFRPSFVDVGELQTRACGLSAKWRLREYAPFPDEYLREVRNMVRHHVRHIQEITVEADLVKFVAKDDYGVYHYGFHLKESWFANR